MSNGLDPGQARRYVGPDLGPNCLQRLSTDDKVRRWQAKSYVFAILLEDFAISSKCSLTCAVRCIINLLGFLASINLHEC